jgi:hypothetical protein
MSLRDLWQILMNSVGLWFSTLSNLYHLYQQPKACIKRADASTQLLPVADQHHHKISPGFENLVKYLTFYKYIYTQIRTYIHISFYTYIYLYTIIQYYTYIVIHRWLVQILHDLHLAMCWKPLCWWPAWWGRWPGSSRATVTMDYGIPNNIYIYLLVYKYRVINNNTNDNNNNKNNTI